MSAMRTLLAVIAVVWPLLSWGQDGGLPDVLTPKADGGTLVEPQLDLAMDVGPRQAYVGDLIQYKLTIVHDPSVEIHLPATLSFGPFDLVSKDRAAVTLEGGRVEETFTFKITTYEVGEQEIPEIAVPYVTAQGNTGEVKAQKVTIIIQSTLKAGADGGVDILPQKGALAVMTDDWTLAWMFGVLGGVGLIVLITMLIMGRAIRPSKVAWQAVPLRPAHEVALEKLREVREDQLAEKGEAEIFTVRVSEAVREYLGGRYGFDSLELTTSELMEQMKGADLQGMTSQEVYDLLLDTDLVKFARYTPSQEDMGSILERAFGLVERTMPRVVPPHQAAGGR